MVDPVKHEKAGPYEDAYVKLKAEVADFHNRLWQHFVTAVKCETITDEDSGMVYAYFHQIIKNNREEILILFQKLLLQNFTSHTGVVSNILHLLKSENYNNIYPEGVSIAIACLSSQYSDIKELAVQCFENWENPDCVKYLKNYSTGVQWLDEYVQEVIKELTDVKDGNIPDVGVPNK